MRRLLLFILFALCAIAQSTTPAGEQLLTLDMGNGRLWAMMPANAKLAYLVGIKDILIAVQSPESDKYLAPQFSTGEVIKAIDQIYEMPENSTMPITWALEPDKLEVQGIFGERPGGLAAEFRRILSKPSIDKK